MLRRNKVSNYEPNEEPPPPDDGVVKRGLPPPSAANGMPHLSSGVPRKLAGKEPMAFGASEEDDDNMDVSADGDSEDELKVNDAGRPPRPMKRVVTTTTTIVSTIRIVTTMIRTMVLSTVLGTLCRGR